MVYKEFLLLRRGVLLFLGIFLALGIAADASTHLAHSRVLIRVTEQLVFNASWITAIFAMIYGTSLGQESGEAARLALMRPISRAQAALVTLAMGAVSVAIVFIGGSISYFLPYAITNGLNAFTTFPSWGQATISLSTAALLPIGFALATYGATAAVAVISRRSLVPALLVAPVAVVIYLLSQIPGVQWINVMNPLAIFIAASNIALNPALQHASYGVIGNVDVPVDIGILFTMFVIYAAVAVFQWRRVEV
jgi:hypothetical protein